MLTYKFKWVRDVVLKQHNLIRDTFIATNAIPVDISTNLQNEMFMIHVVRLKTT